VVRRGTLNITGLEKCSLVNMKKENRSLVKAKVLFPVSGQEER